jgi:hypothetical protein
MLVLSFAAIMPVHALDQKVFITTSTTGPIIQSTINDYTDTTHVGDAFTVYLMYSNMTDLYGIQYTLSWNNTILTVTSIKDTLPPWASVFIALNTTTPGQMKFTVTSTSGSYNEPTGFGNVLRKIAFKIMMAPPAGAGSFITTGITLSNVKFANSVPATIPSDVISGTFNYYFVSPPLSTITVGNHTSTSVGEVFGLPVTVSGVDASWKVADVYFELTCNKTLLKALSVIEGGFFKSFGTTTFTSDVSTPGLVKAEVVLTSLATPGVYPSGSGTLATISFNSTYGVAGMTIPSPLHLQNVVVKDISSTNIGYKALVDGSYAIAVPSVPTLTGWALSFDGVDDYVSVPPIDAYVYTFELWFNASSNNALIGSDRFLIQTANDSLIVWYDVNKAPVKFPVAIKTGTWHHLVVTIDYTIWKIAAYLDGSKLGEQSSTTLTKPKITWMTIGSGGSTFFKGVIDEVRIYNKALSDATVIDHYNNGTGYYGRPEPGLLAGWHFDEATGTTANDYSGNGNNGTIVGATHVAGHIMRPNSWGKAGEGRGDVNADGKVDVIDLIIVAKAFGKKLGDKLYDQYADINNDGTVDLFDLIIVSTHLGNHI